MRKSFQRLDRAFEILELDPAEPRANSQVGKFYCVEKRDWQRGLEYLKKSSDAELAETARQDWASPTEPKQQSELGDRWWGRADSSPRRERSSW